MTLDAGKSRWLRISLGFFLKPQSLNRHRDRDTHSALDSLQFVATDRGLLCRSTSTYGHMIVCNLVTKSWKDLWLSPSFGQKELIS
ncbi:hypothetical protein MPTK2_3g04560 [Marchantia polymorpha subsp. ruderalis]